MKTHNKTGFNTTPLSLPGNWQEMTGEEKYQHRIRIWADARRYDFKTPELAELYEKRARRILDVVALKEPDEVPVYLLAEGYIVSHCGIQTRDVFYDTDQFISALHRLHHDFDPDYSILSFFQSGKALDTLGMKLIRWPGSRVMPGATLSDDTAFQYVEDEYMRTDEYDELIHNPEGYVIRKYYPRILGNLSGLSHLPNAFNLVETTGFASLMLGLAPGAPARQALDLLLKAADQSQKDLEKYLAAYAALRYNHGTPHLFGGVTKAPYDMIGDTMRCTIGIVKDIYNRPEKVQAAVEALVPMAVQTGVQMAEISGSPFVLIPLHKGSDDFLSHEQFTAFYWPTLKKTMTGIIDHGLIPVPFVEGTFTRRLDAMAADPLPKAKSMWIFDRTDMKAAKEKLGGWACIGGNVPASLFKQGSVKMLESYCRNLMESCAQGGGFCLFPGTIIDHANPENIKAYLNCGKKFGIY